uniref:Putative reverse transcriptase n=1 Tax=Anopheles darlingi TaxID=43151 RepID=A0A2M4CKD9_ANODA
MHCVDAHNLLTQAARDVEVEVILISDPWKVPKMTLWQASVGQSAAIFACGTKPIQKVRCQASGMVVADIGGITYASCYAPPRWTFEQFQSMLRRLEATLRGCPKVVVGGDFNAWHTAWGSVRNNRRGAALLEMMEGIGLVCANVGNTQTFLGNHVGASSIVDVTFATPNIVQDWHVHECLTRSDHAQVRFRIGDQTVDRRPPQATGAFFRRWCVKQFDPQAYKLALDACGLGDATTVAEVTSRLTEACDEVMWRVSVTPRAHYGRPVYWWTDEIAELRDACFWAQRTAYKPAPPDVRQQRQQFLRETRKKLKKAIKTSKRRCLQELADAVEDNPFGESYNIVRGWLRGGPTPQERDPEILRNIASELFPRRQPSTWPLTEPGDGLSLRPVTNTELHDIAKRLNPRKAPGPDGIPNAAVRTALLEHTDTIRRVFQQHLESGVFPEEWKRQRLVLLPKPGKQPGPASALRPLCMISNLGKVFERVILDRLNDVLEFSEDGPRLAPQQHGFRKGRSTVGAMETLVEKALEAYSAPTDRDRPGVLRHCAAIALDVRNAFNTASWTAIGRALHSKGVPSALLRLLQSYLSGRELLYDSYDGVQRWEVTAGVPQGSILGPTLWNVMYDAVLSVPLPAGTDIIAYADDLLIVAAGDEQEKAMENAVGAAIAVQRWLAENDLKLAVQKTEAIIFSRKRTRLLRTFELDGERLPIGDTLRYLGVTFNRHLDWKNHTKAVAEKAERHVRSLRALMPNHGGPSSSVRRILASVAESTMRYAAPIWGGEAMGKQENRRVLQRVQGPLAPRVVGAFVSMGYWVKVLLANMIPMELLLEEDVRYHSARQEVRLAGEQVSPASLRAQERAVTYAKWQDEWDEMGTGRSSTSCTRWTYRLIPNVRCWSERRHGEVDFYLSQVLTDHGFFRAYLEQRKFTDSSDCSSCPGVPENAQHVFFECPRFQAIREQWLEDCVPENMVSRMLECSEYWGAVKTAAKLIMRQLQTEWCLHQQQDSMRRSLADDDMIRIIAETRRQRRNERQRRRRAIANARPVTPQEAVRRKAVRKKRNMQQRVALASRPAPPHKMAVAQARVRVAITKEALQEPGLSALRETELRREYRWALADLKEARRLQRNHRQQEDRARRASERVQ